jgi:competence protein ComGC
MNLKEFKQVKSKGGDKKIMKTKIKQEKGITLIALVVTIVVLLILAGVSVNAIFSENGIIKRAKDAQNKMDQATQKDLDAINELNNWIDGKINGSSGENTTGGNTTGGDDTSTTQKISTLVGKVVDKNTKAEDAYGNKITIPKGFKVLAKGTSTESASYTYSGNNIPAVQDGIVIENGTDGNQFVWVPVGTIKNKDGSTNTITLGRYSNFAKQNGTYVPAQNANNCTQEVTINTYFKELSTFREGNTATDSTAQNATARNLAEFISTSLSNGGYYIARFEASGTASKITSKYNQTVLGNITQPNAAKVAREMYGEVKENNELVYASDLVNSYAWDTAIIFIQTYSTETDASSYASQNKSTSFANTGKSNDKYCNIFDMSGNADEWTTEYSTNSYNSNFYPCVYRGGFYYTGNGKAYNYTSNRNYNDTTYSDSNGSLRSLLYVK